MYTSIDNLQEMYIFSISLGLYRNMIKIDIFFPVLTQKSNKKNLKLS